jgi:hypothetical protein
MKLDDFDRRLKEVISEIGDLEAIFSEVSQVKIDNSDATVESINKLRISGFIGYHLAQEGLALINLIGILLVSNQDRQKDFAYVGQVEPLLQKALQSMEMYKTLTSKEIIERAIGGRAGSES